MPERLLTKVKMLNRANQLKNRSACINKKMPHI